jgi:eIF-2B alpha/beta/delta-like uncharacterized protein
MDFLMLEKQVKDMSVDKSSSATELAIQAVKVFVEYVEVSGGLGKDTFYEGLARLSDLLRKAQPSMTSIGNVVDIVGNQIAINSDKMSLSEFRTNMTNSLSRLQVEIANSRKLIAKCAMSLIPHKATIITHSDSSTVQEVIKQAHANNKVSRVIIPESRPLLEGLKVADLLLEWGIPVTVIVDAAMGFFCREADIALVGADTTQSDGSVVHKVGTYLLAMACSDLKKPFYVACDTLKFSKTATYKQPVKIESKPPSEIINQSKLVGADIRNVYFDITPPKYITRIVTEKGIFFPNELHEHVLAR